MAVIRLPQNSFSNGVLVEDRLRGRYDLKQYLAGARTLHNVASHPQGGVYRRPGTIYMSNYTAKGTVFKFIKFDYSDTISYMLVFYSDKIDVWKDNALVHTITSTGITPTILAEMDFIQRANSLIMVHDTMAPKELSRGASDILWTLGAITFKQIPLFGFNIVVASPAGTVTPSAIAGNITLTASGTPFLATDVGGYITGNGGEARITKFISTSIVEARVILAFVNTSAITTGSWDLENGYSAAWNASTGWPRSVAYDNDSLVMGGTRSLPDAVWKSAIGDQFNFDDTRATADGALSTNLSSEQINDIRFMISGNDFVILTSEAEFYVDGDFTPDLNFKIRKQEERGCRSFIKPNFVDGAPMYIDARADVLRELTFSDIEGKYSSTNLSLFSPGLIVNPSSLVHQKPTGFRDNDYVWIINGDGTWVLFNTLRKQDINGFTTGSSRSDELLDCADLDGVLYAMFKRDVDGGDVYYMERFTDEVTMDCVLEYSGADISVVTGLGFLEDEVVKVVAEGFVVGEFTVVGGEITLPAAYGEITVGLAYNPLVVTLPPPANLPDGTAIGEIRRVIAVSLGLSNTGQLTVNGQPVRTRQFGQPIFDAPAPLINGRTRVYLRGGYNRDPVVEITQSDPLPFHLTDLILEVNT
ncbi:hypothetical protein KAR91_54480 [Candidatus Pacearchaeota archaeon]|nr:hypothetical protein [Candidatus Pacearchaeota archaeon]